MTEYLLDESPLAKYFKELSNNQKNNEPTNQLNNELNFEQNLNKEKEKEKEIQIEMEMEIEIEIKTEKEKEKEKEKAKEKEKEEDEKEKLKKLLSKSLLKTQSNSTLKPHLNKASTKKKDIFTKKKIQYLFRRAKKHSFKYLKSHFWIPNQLKIYQSETMSALRDKQVLSLFYFLQHNDSQQYLSTIITYFPIIFSYLFYCFYTHTKLTFLIALIPFLFFILFSILLSVVHSKNLNLISTFYNDEENENKKEQSNFGFEVNNNNNTKVNSNKTPIIIANTNPNSNTKADTNKSPENNFQSKCTSEEKERIFRAVWFNYNESFFNLLKFLQLLELLARGYKIGKGSAIPPISRLEDCSTSEIRGLYLRKAMLNSIKFISKLLKNKKEAQNKNSKNFKKNQNSKLENDQDFNEFALRNLRDKHEKLYYSRAKFFEQILSNWSLINFLTFYPKVYTIKKLLYKEVKTLKKLYKCRYRLPFDLKDLDDSKHDILQRNDNAIDPNSRINKSVKVLQNTLKQLGQEIDTLRINITLCENKCIDLSPELFVHLQTSKEETNEIHEQIFSIQKNAKEILKNINNNFDPNNATQDEDQNKDFTGDVKNNEFVDPQEKEVFDLNSHHDPKNILVKEEYFEFDSEFEQKTETKKQKKILNEIPFGGIPPPPIFNEKDWNKEEEIEENRKKRLAKIEKNRLKLDNKNIKSKMVQELKNILVLQQRNSKK
ncbi:hypothetical protein M0812_26302 [Anaeramoeba flamelloides]|uniref:Uncharacterized protein n=1 Tax=Anaeramoeba flamelloides TaxID=1746091 RepID=A0AAV7YB73_9EUKA|nr:hypothetical protein M0812_26302 [Anaeramoeba flamelloides]